MKKYVVTSMEGRHIPMRASIRPYNGQSDGHDTRTYYKYENNIKEDQILFIECTNKHVDVYDIVVLPTNNPIITPDTNVIIRETYKYLDEMIRMSFFMDRKKLAEEGSISAEEKKNSGKLYSEIMKRVGKERSTNVPSIGRPRSITEIYSKLNHHVSNKSVVGVTNALGLTSICSDTFGETFIRVFTWKWIERKFKIDGLYINVPTYKTEDVKCLMGAVNPLIFAPYAQFDELLNLKAKYGMMCNHDADLFCYTVLKTMKSFMSSRGCTYMKDIQFKELISNTNSHYNVRFEDFLEGAVIDDSVNSSATGYCKSNVVWYFCKFLGTIVRNDKIYTDESWRIENNIVARFSDWHKQNEKVEPRIDKLGNDVLLIDGTRIKLSRDCMSWVMENMPVTHSQEIIDESPKYRVIDLTHLCGEQIHAIICCILYPFNILTGAAGTGKSSTLGAIYEILRSRGEMIQLTSFTGKAVSRLTEIIPKDKQDIRASTMDKIIVTRSSNTNLTEFTVLISDEVSMISIVLMHRFLISHDRQYKLILVGDINQLPPIEDGNLFHEIYRSCAGKLTRLIVNHRISSVGTLASVVDSLTDTRGMVIMEDSDDFRRFPTDNIMESLNTIRNIMIQIREHVPHQSIRIMSLVREPIEQLNKMVIEIYSGIIPIHAKDFVIGQLVMVNKNCYDYDIMSGEEGVIVGIEGYAYVCEFNDGHRVMFDSNITSTSSKEKYNGVKRTLGIDIIDSCYATTVHKAQGSEFKTVILFIPHVNSNNLEFHSKNIIYTALSRGKHVVYVVGDMNCLDECIKNSLSFDRQCTIGDRIREVCSITEEAKELKSMSQMLDDKERMENGDDIDFSEFY